jgi:hypothetical protein
MGFVGPGAVKAVGGTQSMALIAKGTPMPIPERLQVHLAS